MAKVFIRGVAYIGEELPDAKSVARVHLRAVEIEVDVPESGDIEDDDVSVTMTTKARLRKLPEAVKPAAAALLARVNDEN